MTRLHSPGHVIAWTLALSLLPWTALAERRDDGFRLASKCYATPATVVYVSEQGGTIDVAASPEQMTMVRFPREVTFDSTVFIHKGLDVQQSENEVIVTPRPEFSENTRASLLMTSGEFAATLNVRIAEDPDEFNSLVYVKTVPHEEWERARAAGGQRDSVRTRTATARILLAAKDIRDSHYQPLYGEERVPYRGGFIRVALVRAVSVSGERYLEFVVDNQSSKRVELGAGQILEGERSGVDVDIVMDEDTKTRKDLLALIDPHEQARGMLLIPDSIESSIDVLSVLFKGPSMTQPLIAAAEPIDYYPLTEEEYERKQRITQIIVGLRAFGGGFWIEDGAGLDRSDITSFKGLGVRLTKGLTEYLAFEVEVAGGTTGQARFEDITWEGMQGDIARSASFGRVQFGGILRFGDRISPHVRLGVGGQGTSYDSELDTGGTVAAGSETSFDLSTIWSVGAGVDLRLGQHFLVTIDSLLNERSIEAGIHLGYGWNP